MNTEDWHHSFERMPLSAGAEQALKHSLVADMQLTQLAQGARKAVSKDARPSPHERVVERNQRAQRARATHAFSRYCHFEHNLAKSAHVLGVKPSLASVQEARASWRGLPSLRDIDRRPAPRTAESLAAGSSCVLARPASANPGSAAASEAEGGDNQRVADPNHSLEAGSGGSARAHIKSTSHLEVLEPMEWCRGHEFTAGPAVAERRARRGCSITVEQFIHPPSESDALRASNSMLGLTRARGGRSPTPAQRSNRRRAIQVRSKNGIGVFHEPVYPSTAFAGIGLGHLLEVEPRRTVVTKFEDDDGKDHTIRFFKLLIDDAESDGPIAFLALELERGAWVHDFDPEAPGVPTIEEVKVDEPRVSMVDWVRDNRIAAANHTQYFRRHAAALRAERDLVYAVNAERARARNDQARSARLDSSVTHKREIAETRRQEVAHRESLICCWLVTAVYERACGLWMQRLAAERGQRDALARMRKYAAKAAARWRFLVFRRRCRRMRKIMSHSITLVVQMRVWRKHASCRLLRRFLDDFKARAPPSVRSLLAHSRRPHALIAPHMAANTLSASFSAFCEQSDECSTSCVQRCRVEGIARYCLSVTGRGTSR